MARLLVSSLISKSNKFLLVVVEMVAAGCWASPPVIVILRLSPFWERWLASIKHDVLSFSYRVARVSGELGLDDPPSFLYGSG